VDGRKFDEQLPRNFDCFHFIIIIISCSSSISIVFFFFFLYNIFIYF